MSYTGRESEEEHISIIVSDTGIGIPADKQEKIFERFFQNDVPDNIHNPGTGIGLAITKEFVKLHNGTITVNSEPDKGSSFLITLPVKPISKGMLPKEESPALEPRRQDTVARVPEKEESGRKTRRPMVLLVEDNDDFRFYLKDNLKQEYEVVETFDGYEAWQKLAELKPDLIVSDVMMPHMDGIELTRKIKKNPSLAPIPVILLTAAGDEDMQLESYQLGVSDYMIKPFTYEILASRIKNLLAQPLRREAKYAEVNPSEIEIEPLDAQFLKQAKEIVEKNIANPDFTVEEMSRDLFMHRAGLYRKLLALTGKTPLEFIRIIRLKRGRQLLEKSGLTIAEVAYDVGFNNPKKFSQYFKEEFGMTPSQFQKTQSPQV